MRVTEEGDYESFREFKNDWISVEQAENENFNPNQINEKQIADDWMRGYHGRR